MKLFEKAESGESVQIDVKFVKIAGRSIQALGLRHRYIKPRRPQLDLPRFRTHLG